MIMFLYKQTIHKQFLAPQHLQFTYTSTLQLHRFRGDCKNHFILIFLHYTRSSVPYFNVAGYTCRKCKRQDLRPAFTK